MAATDAPMEVPAPMEQQPTAHIEPAALLGEDAKADAAAAADGFMADDDEFNSPPDDPIGKPINITTDGGVVKTVLVQGTGWERPETHDVVTVHYVGTLASDGTKFDASRDRNEPFTFNLGEGRVIKGWDLGVASMKKGEKAVLTCKAEYAYGESGSPPKIPPGATLNFEVELLSWSSVKDIAGDGGVIKTIEEAGTDWQSPNDGDEVLVTYKARVQGATEPFASSGPEGVEFTMGQAPPEGLQGIPVAVKTMKKGERVHLVLKPEYACGTEGRPDQGVAGDATVEVELQLVSWKKVEDVTPDGLLVKKTLIDSTEWKRPNDGAQVTVRVVGKLADGTVFLSHPEGSELTFTTDEEVVPLGLDQAVLKMKKGEKAVVTVAPSYGYKELGAKAAPLDAAAVATEVDAGAGAAPKLNLVADVPPNAALTFEVELVDVENAKESWEMGDAEKVEAAEAKKEKANKAYRDGRTERAIHLWDKASTLVNHDKTFPEDLKAKAREVRRSVQLNLAAAHLKLQHWKEAAVQCGKVLETDAFHAKALYRRAQAFIGSGDYVEAEEDVKKGLTQEPNNADLLTLMRKVKALLKDQAKKESALYSRMFKFPANKPAAATAPAAAATDPVAAAETAAAVVEAS